MTHRTDGHRRRTIVCSALLNLLTFSTAEARAEDLPDLSLWDRSGSSTLRYDNYRVSGDKTASPYPRSGPQIYNETSLSLGRRFTPFDRMHVQITGLLFNDSDDRSAFRGLVPERIHIRRENGEERIPYRLDVGDFFAFQSRRTIQRSLKGAQIELQPDLQGPARQSLILFSGGGSASWRDFHLQDDWFSGASWLVEHPRHGRLAANVVVNTRQADAAAGQSGIRQWVYSLAFEKAVEWQGQQLTLEGEVARLFGDYPTAAGTARGRRGDGWFLQATGSPRGLPALSYRLRVESHDQDYRPNGGSIQSGRRSAEAHLSWRFSNGASMRARAQTYRSDWQTTNHTDTRVLGVRLTGVPGMRRMPGLSTWLDAFEERARSLDRTTDRTTRSVTLHLGRSIAPTLFARGSLQYSRLRDHAAADEQKRVQATLGLDWRFRRAGYRGVLSPGLILEDTRLLGGGDRNELHPTLNLSLDRGPHRLSANLSARKLDTTGATPDVLTRRIGLDYRFTRGAGSWGVEANWYERDPDTGAGTDAWHLGAFFTWTFDKPARTRAGARGEAAPPAARAPGPVRATDRLSIDPARFRPGLAVETALALARDAGLGEPVTQAGLLVWSERILRRIVQPQRLALETDGGTVSRAALVIEFDDVGDGASREQTFSRVRHQLLQIYGPPDTVHDRGEFGPSLAADLQTGRFFRVMEWRRDGATLRFGIPRRLDGQVRMELQVAKRFPALRDGSWSLENLP